MVDENLSLSDETFGIGYIDDEEVNDIEDEGYIEDEEINDIEDEGYIEDEIIDFGNTEEIINTQVLNNTDDTTTDDNEYEEDDIEDEIIDFGNTDSEIVSENVIEYNDKDLIAPDGTIKVQDTDNNSNSFKLVYIDINNIAVTNRIRKNINVDSLVKSIKSTGLLTPIVVVPLKTDGIYALIDGYRRLIACARTGITQIPCVINTKISTPDIPILEALYNHSSVYHIKELISYIEYLEKEKGIFSASMIEYLLQLDAGDYTKLKDILNDDDDDIVSALLNEQITIAQAFKKLEQRRKKESKEQKELRNAEKVYEDTQESGANSLEGSGEEGSEEMVLSDDEIADLTINVNDLSDVDDNKEDLDNMIEESKQMDGFEPNKQDYKNREILDPSLRKAVLARDDNTCQCCGLHGPEYVDVFDIHHIVEVYLGGNDALENLITECTVCHKLIHKYARGELYMRPTAEMTPEEVIKFKKIIKLGNVIREGMKKRNMKVDDLKKVDKADTIGRTKPGTPSQQAT